MAVSRPGIGARRPTTATYRAARSWFRSLMWLFSDARGKLGCLQDATSSDPISFPMGSRRLARRSQATASTPRSCSAAEGTAAAGRRHLPGNGGTWQPGYQLGRGRSMMHRWSESRRRWATYIDAIVKVTPRLFPGQQECAVTAPLVDEPGVLSIPRKRKHHGLPVQNGVKLSPASRIRPHPTALSPERLPPNLVSPRHVPKQPLGKGIFTSSRAIEGGEDAAWSLPFPRSEAEVRGAEGPSADRSRRSRRLTSGFAPSCPSLRGPSP